MTTHETIVLTGFKYVQGVEKYDEGIRIKMGNGKWYELLIWLERQIHLYNTTEPRNLKLQYYQEWKEVHKITRQFGYSMKRHYFLTDVDED